MVDAVQLGVFNYTNEQYHASEGLSRSKLWTFKQLPAKFWYEYMSGEFERAADKDAYVLGDLVHTLALEPNTFSSRYVVAPNIDKRTKAGKEQFANLLIEAGDRQLIKPEVLSVAREMNNALIGNATVAELLCDAKMEKSIYWKHEATGLVCKARPDIWQGRIVSDLKTTQDAGYRSFQQSAYKYGYFLQAAMIYEALKFVGEPFQTFVFICIEKTKPYSLGLYMLDDEALQFGLDMFHSLMERIAICYEKNVWPDYGVQKLMVPRYATLEMDNAEI